MLLVSRRTALAALLGCCLVACGIDTQGSAAENGGAAPGGSGNLNDSGIGAASGGVAGAANTGGASGIGGATDAGGSSGVGGASGSAGTGSEKCLDGIDNDGNGLVDCSDPACQIDFECGTAAPQGWQGYFRLREQDNDASATAPIPCPDGTLPTRLFTRPAPAQCSQCSCGAISGATCSPAQILCSPGTSDCGSPQQDWTTVWQDKSCHKTGDYSRLSCSVQPSNLVSPGACAPSGGSYTPSPLFDGLADICGQSTSGGGGCGSGEACVPRASGAYAGFLCVRKQGIQTSCPTGWGLKVVTYQGGTDQRSCSPCLCKPAGEKCSTGVYTFWDENDCTTCSLFCHDPIQVGQGCTDVSVLLDNSTWSAKLTAVPAETGGSCAPSGGQPTGSVQGQGAVTFCCSN